MSVLSTCFDALVDLAPTLLGHFPYIVIFSVVSMCWFSRALGVQPFINQAKGRGHLAVLVFVYVVSGRPCKAVSIPCCSLSGTVASRCHPYGRPVRHQSATGFGFCCG